MTCECTFHDNDDVDNLCQSHQRLVVAVRMAERLACEARVFEAIQLCKPQAYYLLKKMNDPHPPQRVSVPIEGWRDVIETSVARAFRSMDHARHE